MDQKTLFDNRVVRFENGTIGCEQGLLAFSKESPMKSYQRIVAILALLIVATGLDAWGQVPKTGVDVVNPRKGWTSIVLMKPAGTVLKAGGMVCELDASALTDLLENQRITTRGAEARYRNSRLTREVAEIAVSEYLEGIYAQDLKTAEGEIALAESDRKRAEERLKWAEMMGEKGYLAPKAVDSEKVALERAQVMVSQAKKKKTVLEEYTMSKTIKELKSEVEKSRSDELAKKAILDLEKTIENRLEAHFKHFRIVAPVAGRVVYPRPFDADTLFREGDVLFRIVPEDQPK